MKRPELPNLVAIVRDPKKRMIAAASIVGVLLVGAAGWWALVTQPPAPAMRSIEERSRPFNVCVQRSSMWLTRGDYHQAAQWTGEAIDWAPTVEDRARAGLEMGRLLLRNPEANLPGDALAARQYFSEVADISKDPSRRLDAYRGVIRASDMLHDKTGAIQTARSVLALATNADEKAELYLLLVDACLQDGTLQEVQDILKEARPFMVTPQWNEPYMFRTADAVERVLKDEEWFENYAAQYPTNDAATVRAEVMNKIIEQYRKIAANGTRSVKSECQYRVARLYIQEKRFDEGRKALQAYVETASSKHIPETLLLLFRVAKAAGDDVAVRKMLVAIVNRYRVDEQALDDVFGVLDDMEQNGHVEEALSLLRQCTRIAAIHKHMQGILYRAGQMALQLRLYGEADDYFTRLLESEADDRLKCDALIGRADVCILQTNWVGAQTMLLNALTRYPRDENRGSILMRLFDVTVAKGASPTQILLIGTAATQANPRDPRSIDIRLRMARLLEKTGLYSLAESEFSQIAVLNYLSTATSRTGAVVTAVNEATLGKARCLLSMGEIVRSDRLLREICRTYEPGPTRSEAAYLWATIAFQSGQFEEGMRRLSLIDVRDATADLAARVEVEKNLAEISTGRKAADTMDQVLASLATLTDREQTEFVRRAYTAYFDWLVGQGNLNDLQAFIDRTAKGPHAKELPMGTWALRLAGAVLANDGVSGYADCLARNASVLAAAPEAQVVDNRLLDSARQVEKVQTAVAKFL